MEQPLAKHYAAVYKELCYPRALDSAIKICHTKKWCPGQEFIKHHPDYLKTGNSLCHF